MWEFKHSVSNFSVAGVLMAAGMNPRNPAYAYLQSRTLIVIEEQVHLSALRLNTMLQDQYRKDMSDIEEYQALPDYITTMTLALSSPDQVGVYWKKGVAQVKFVDTDKLGDLSDLQQIQQEAYPTRGTLAQWTNLYNAWLRGTDTRIRETLLKRISMMQSRTIAPFWQLVEFGNLEYPAYPQNGPKGTLESFKPFVSREMRRAFNESVRLVSLMVMAQGLQFPNLETTYMTAENKEVFGYKWVSQSGKNVFAMAGTEKIIGGRLSAKGFILSAEGLILRKWTGWLPR